MTSLQITHGETQIARLDVGEAPGRGNQRAAAERGDANPRDPRAPSAHRCLAVVLFTARRWRNLVAGGDRPSSRTNRLRLRFPACEAASPAASAQWRQRNSGRYSADSEFLLAASYRPRLLIDLQASHCEPGRVNLAAMIDLRGHAGVTPHEIVWHSDIEGELGRGHMLSIDLEEGRHLITATIPGGANDRVQKTGIIIVGGRGR